MKRIVLCTDGTWDKPASGTNVSKVANSSLVTADQVTYYDDGVGSSGTPIQQLTGGAFGLGLFQKIKQGYTQVAHLYDQDDQIFLFGFSRGAYTARSLAGMIAVCGLPTKNFDDNMVELAFQAYRNKDQRPALLAQLNQQYAMYDAKITMVGVWDTVGSLGIPSMFGGIDLIAQFLDTSLHPDVLNAYQAIAIDEKRVEFPPTLWTSQPAPGQTMEQVWFVGCHSDIGGGTSEESDGTALSDVALSWMMSKAWVLGLKSDPAFQARYTALDPKYALDSQHDSWNPLWGFWKHRTIANDASLSNSVVVRCQHDSSYNPPNVDRPNGVPASHYQIVHVVNAPAQAAAAAS